MNVRSRVATVAVVVLSSRFAGAQTLDAGAARDLLKKGYELRQAGKCGEAIPTLAESARLDPTSTAFLNLADCEEQTGKLVDARKHWISARERGQAEGNQTAISAAAPHIQKLDQRIPKIVIKVPAGVPADATVLRDGVTFDRPSWGTPLAADPGTHQLVLKASGYADSSASVTLKESETKDVALVLGAKSAAPPPVVTPGTSAAAPPPNSAASGDSWGNVIKTGVSQENGDEPAKPLTAEELAHVRSLRFQAFVVGGFRGLYGKASNANTVQPTIDIGPAIGVGGGALIPVARWLDLFARAAVTYSSHGATVPIPSTSDSSVASFEAEGTYSFISLTAEAAARFRPSGKAPFFLGPALRVGYASVSESITLGSSTKDVSTTDGLFGVRAEFGYAFGKNEQFDVSIGVGVFTLFEDDTGVQPEGSLAVGYNF